MLLKMVESEMTQWFNASTVLNSDAPSQVLGYDPHLGVPQFFYYDKHMERADRLQRRLRRRHRV